MFVCLIFVELHRYRETHRDHQIFYASTAAVAAAGAVVHFINVLNRHFKHDACARFASWKKIEKKSLELFKRFSNL